MGELSRTRGPGLSRLHTHAKEGHLDRVLRDRPWVMLPRLMAGCLGDVLG
jgi:hypothetical protein